MSAARARASDASNWPRFCSTTSTWLWLAAKAGASFVSPFVGRLDDVGESGMALIADIMQIFNAYHFKTEVLVASVRSPMHVIEAAKMGAHVATLPPPVLREFPKPGSSR